MLARVDSDELTEWMAFDRLEPVGTARIEQQLAVLSAMFANAHRDPKKTGAFSAEDFLPRSPEERQEFDQRRKLAEDLKAALGALVKE